MTSRPPGVLERSIHFFRVDVGRDETQMPLAFKHRAALTAIDRLQWKTRARYLELGEGSEVACWVDDARAGRLVFGNIRRTGLPQLEEAGALADLRLAANQSLTDSTHVRFFANNIVGCDFNFYGPRMSRLATYLRAKDPDRCEEIAFHRLLRHDMVERLDQLDGLRLFRLRVMRSAIDVLEQADDSLAEAFRAQAALGESDELEVLVKVESYARGRRIDPKFKRMARRLLRRPEVLPYVRAFHVSGRDPEKGETVDVDLLNDALISKQQVVRLGDRGRAVDPDSAFEAIRHAYTQLRTDLEKAAAVAADQPDLLD
ncbi:MAG: hypothetical protein AB7I38_17255 [Dehalococcoidia bacterium]